MEDLREGLAQERCVGPGENRQLMLPHVIGGAEHKLRVGETFRQQIVIVNAG